MPLGRRIIDRSWHFVRHLSHPVLQNDCHEPLRRGVKILIGCQKRPQRQAHQQSFPTNPRINAPPLWKPACLQLQRNTRWKSSLPAHYARDRARMRELDVASAYQELRRLTLKGNYAHIRDNVEILVKERCQKPNLRLYDALLLANTDNEHGSAGEVVGILDKIAVDGLAPDSTTYHAALRVGNLDPGLQDTLAHFI